MRTILLLFVACLGAALIANHFLIASTAQTESHPVLTNRPKKVGFNRTAETIRAFEELIETAEKHGSARVIVGLRFDSFQPDGELDAARQSQQRQAIGLRQQDLLNKLGNFDVQHVVKYKFIPFVAMQADADAVRFMQQATTEVESIAADQIHEASLFESTQQISAPAAWSSGFTGQGQVVAVLDTGVDKYHPFLNGKVVSEACFSTTASSGGNNFYSVCPNGAPSSTAANSGLPMPSIVEGYKHGTHVAGIAAGRNSSISGVGRDAGIIAVQVFTARETNPNAPCPPGYQYCATSFSSNWISGLERVYELRTAFNIAAVNMSLGGGAFVNYCDNQNPAATAAINTLRAANIATVIASGNGAPNANGVASPACISSAVSVGAVTDGSPDQNGTPTVIDRVTSFSQASPILNLLAPGAGILSSTPNNGSEVFDGTSMAAPHVAGAWAVLKQRVPNASVTQVLNALSSSGVPIYDPRYNLTRPRIKLDAALAALAGGGGCQATPISIGQTVNGSLTSSDCPNQGFFNDHYSFSGTQGQQIAVSYDSAAYDTYLFLLNSNNQVVAQDDDGGGGTNSRIPPGTSFLSLPATGNYTIVATSFNAGAVGNYTLRLLTNQPSCSYSINPSSANVGANGGSVTANVTTNTGCGWTATSNANWITVTSGQNNSGSGSVNLSVQQNTAVARSGTVTIAGQTLTVNQAGTGGTGNTWIANDISVGSDNKTRVLWTVNDGRAAIWTVSAGSQNVESNFVFGPFAGWTARRIAVGSDNKTRVLWNNTNGQMAIWTVSPASTNIESVAVHGAFDGWTASDIAVGADNKPRVLWNSTDGRGALWTVSASNSQTVESNFVFGPYDGWTPRRIAAGADNKTRILWNHTNGQAALWKVSPASTNIESVTVHGAFEGWTANDIAAGGADDKTRVLWNHADARMAFWVMRADNTIEVNNVHGAFAGWTARAIGAGADNKLRVLWNHTDGRGATWTLSSANSNIEENYVYGPYPQ